MSTPTEFFARSARTALAASVALLATALLAACTGLPAPPPAAPPADVPPPLPVASSAVPPAAPPVAPPAPDNEALVRVLAYADRVRAMSGTELNQEVTRLGNAYIPANQLQLAVVLAQLRQMPELIRAQELLTRLLANPDAEAQPLHPLARLLASRYGEQRRLEDLLDKQGQQTREVQRRLDQTHERLEALKAIERSLTSRPPPPPPPAPPTPVSRARPPAPVP